MPCADRALRAVSLRVGVEADRLGAELARMVERLGAAARWRDRLAARHADWEAALRGGLAASPLDPRRLQDLERRRREAHDALQSARRVIEALRRQEAALREQLARLRHRQDGLERLTDAAVQAAWQRQESSIGCEIEDAWNARASGARA